MTARTSTFFGDKPRDLILMPELVTELERLTGQGIGGFSRRVMQSVFKLLDLHHISLRESWPLKPLARLDFRSKSVATLPDQTWASSAASQFRPTPAAWRSSGNG
ncbi:hypothetical protein [Paracoccus sp. IB05]|uniref:hypothetical protein n=1 Tax=Paracoccus sp. IB05 TaxID=2779367 RepID=UPI0018E7B320|nr:hypothetical protein [Paracoccus sp. IB05]MBJ2149714.1 hypothetical protein [Paracoccus sp. IB05]